VWRDRDSTRLNITPLGIFMPFFLFFPLFSPLHLSSLVLTSYNMGRCNLSFPVELEQVIVTQRRDGRTSKWECVIVTMSLLTTILISFLCFIVIAGAITYFVV
jgi:hypothetical protein